MKVRMLGVALVLAVAVGGCSWTDFAFVHPAAETKIERQEIREGKAFEVGETQGGFLLETGRYSAAVIVSIHVELDSMVKAVYAQERAGSIFASSGERVAAPPRRMTTYSLRQMLVAEGVGEADADQIVAQANVVVAVVRAEWEQEYGPEALQQRTRYIGRDEAGVFQAFLQGMWYGIDPYCQKVLDGEVR